MTSLKLDRVRALKWTHRSDALIGSLERPPELKDLLSKNRRRAFYVLCAYLWAALVDRDGLSEPEALAEYVGGDDEQVAAWRALRSALEEAGVISAEKKTSDVTTGSPPGPSASLNSASPAPATKT